MALSKTHKCTYGQADYMDSLHSAQLEPVRNFGWTNNTEIKSSVKPARYGEVADFQRESNMSEVLSNKYIKLDVNIFIIEICTNCI